MKWLERLIMASIGFFGSYFILALMTDLRIDRLRPFINQRAIEVGVERGIKLYHKKFTDNESLMVKKRAARDNALKEYVGRLNQILEME